jgi:hypothetical protein
MTGLKSLIIRNISLRLVKCITPSYSTLNYRNQYVCCRQFHITNTCLAKAKRDKKIKEDIDNEVNEVGLPDIKNYEVMMDSRIFKLEEEFDKLRAGRPTADMLNHITVEADNSRIKITDAGQISMKNQNQIVISVFDPNNVQYVVAALKADTALNSNPATEGNNVVVSVPKPSKENRETLVKSVIRLSEKVNLYIYIFVYSCT